MQLGMIGLGRMGGSMVRRLLRGGHQCVVYDVHAEAMAPLAGEGAVASNSLADFVARLQVPRPQHVSQHGRAHRHARMSRLGLLHRVDRQHSEGVDAEVVAIAHDSRMI